MDNHTYRHYTAERLRLLLEQWLAGEALDPEAVRQACREFDQARRGAPCWRQPCEQ